VVIKTRSLALTLTELYGILSLLIQVSPPGQQPYDSASLQQTSGQQAFEAYAATARLSDFTTST
jgi:hypothetical protein